MTPPKRIEELFAPRTAVEHVRLHGRAFPLHPAETAHVAAAVPKRQREFAAGRWCARRALARLGITDFPLLAGPDRAPRWPAAVVGSITHTDTFCIAVAGRRASVAALGVDAEPDRPLEAELWEIVCTPAERHWLATQPAAARGRLARLLFSAKECLYKLQYPLTGALLDFQDAEIAPDLDGGRFTARLLRDAGACLTAGSVFEGKFLAADGLIVTGMGLTNPERGLTGPQHGMPVPQRQRAWT